MRELSDLCEANIHAQSCESISELVALIAQRIHCSHHDARLRQLFKQRVRSIKRREEHVVVRVAALREVTLEAKAQKGKRENRLLE